jgi:hypothetical protein
MSTGYTITKKRKTEKSQIFVSLAIILILSSFFVPIFILIPLQEILFSPSGEWFFEPLRAAYGVFIAGLLLIAAICITAAVLLSKQRMTTGVKGLLAVSAVIGVLFILLSTDGYHYADQNGITIDPIFSLKEKTYTWDEVAAAEQTAKLSGGIATDDKFIVTFKDGKKYSMVLNNNVVKARVAMQYVLKEKGIEVVKKDPPAE